MEGACGESLSGVPDAAEFGSGTARFSWANSVDNICEAIKRIAALLRD